MSTAVMIGSAVVSWGLLAVLTALMAGRIVQQRDGHHPAEDGPVRARTSVTGQSSLSPRRTLESSR